MMSSVLHLILHTYHSTDTAFCTPTAPIYFRSCARLFEIITFVTIVHRLLQPQIKKIPGRKMSEVKVDGDVCLVPNKQEVFGAIRISSLFLPSGVSFSESLI